MLKTAYARVVLGLILFLSAPPSFSEQQSSVSQSDQANWQQSTYKIDGSFFLLESQNLRFEKIGAASFSYLFWDIYDSTLFYKGNKFDARQPWFEQTPIVLEIRYKRDIKAEDLIESTIEQWQHLNFPTSRYQPYVPWLKAVWPNLKEGDRLALLVYSDFSVFFYNGKFLAFQGESDFGKVFLDIWLSPNTSEPKLRKKLLSIGG